MADISKVLYSIGATQSRTMAKRLIKQGAVEINGEKVGLFAPICDGDIIHCGKRFWGKLRNSDTIMVEVTEDSNNTYIRIL